MRLFGSGRKTRKQKQASDSGDAVSELFRRLKAGEIATAGLMKGRRQRLVEQLTAEGYLTGEISELLEVSDRTVRRDLRAIRISNSVERDPEAVKELVGRLVWQADASVSQTRRAVRSREAKVTDKIEGQRRCWGIVKQLVEMLQRLGFLPCESRGDPEMTRISIEMAARQMINEVHEQKLVQLGLPPGTTPVEKVKVLAAIDAMLATQNIGPGGRKLQAE